MLKVGMVSSFHPHSMCNKVERVTAKTGCTSCTKRTISFEVSGFHTETRLLQRYFIFLNLFELQTFSVFKIHHSKTHHHFRPFLTSFVIFHAFTDYFELLDPKLKSISNELWKGWKLAWYHHFIHIAYTRKLRGLRQKLDALHVQNRQSLSKYHGFIRKLVCYEGISFFKLIWTPDFSCVQNAPFKATSSIFNPLWLHFLFFMHLLLILSYKTLKF